MKQAMKKLLSFQQTASKQNYGSASVAGHKFDSIATRWRCMLLAAHNGIKLMSKSACHMYFSACEQHLLQSSVCRLLMASAQALTLLGSSGSGLGSMTESSGLGSMTFTCSLMNFVRLLSTTSAGLNQRLPIIW